MEMSLKYLGSALKVGIMEAIARALLVFGLADAGPT